MSAGDNGTRRSGSKQNSDGRVASSEATFQRAESERLTFELGSVLAR